MLSTLQAPHIQCFVCTRCSIIISSMISLDESGQHEAILCVFLPKMQWGEARAVSGASWRSGNRCGLWGD